ncbi:hypothetical protein BC830DRAFT_1168977 [Chytriomyces sp. MP71]|nr:hypothetical protein BC830DRAFT_1170108 [Chytriomyces sp. MP71]KAI8614980.1 hypothetical protein BC830DRAFT_1168977 [Chytriomyces sp. MP71]
MPSSRPANGELLSPQQDDAGRDSRSTLLMPLCLPRIKHTRLAPGSMARAMLLALLLSVSATVFFLNAQQMLEDGLVPLEAIGNSTGPPFPMVKMHTLVNGTVILSLSPQPRGCPPIRPALIGIPTILHNHNSVRRAFLRLLYARDPAGVDVRFVFGIPAKQSSLQLAIEARDHPRDTIVTRRREGMNNGKTLDWLRIARSQCWTPHPTVPGQWCRAYSFVGKSDDDSVIHLRRLANLLDGMREGTRFVGRVWGLTKSVHLRHMTGMLYLLSLDMLEWVFWHPEIAVPNEKDGEDLQLANWIRQGNLSVSWEHQEWFHDRERDRWRENKGFSHRMVTENTVIVHHCKNEYQFWKCAMRMYEGYDAWE